jgi:hypothetical protein
MNDNGAAGHDQRADEQRRRTGRPTKLTPAVADAIVTAFGRGCSHKQAAAAGRVHKGTVREWRDRGERDLAAGRPTEFAAFATLYAHARADAVVEMTNVVFEAGRKGNITAATWWLSHVHPEQFGKRPVEVSGGARPLRVDWSQFESVDAAFDWASQGATPDENVARMRSVVMHDMKRRAQRRAQLAAREREQHLARQANGVKRGDGPDGDDGKGAAE